MRPTPHPALLQDGSIVIVTDYHMNSSTRSVVMAAKYIDEQHRVHTCDASALRPWPDDATFGQNARMRNLSNFLLGANAQAAQHDANGVNVGAVMAALEGLKAWNDDPAHGNGALGSNVPNVAANCIINSTSSGRYEQALTYLLGAMDYASGVGQVVGARRIQQCRQELKAAIPGRTRT